MSDVKILLGEEDIPLGLELDLEIGTTHGHGLDRHVGSRVREAGLEIRVGAHQRNRARRYHDEE